MCCLPEDDFFKPKVVTTNLDLRLITLINHKYV